MENGKYRVFVAMPMKEHHRAWLEEAAEGCEIIYSEGRVTKDSLQSVDMIIGNVAPGLLADVSTLKWVQLNSAGVNGYTDEGVLPEGAILTNASGAYGLAIAEHMIGSLLYLMKKLHLYAADQKNEDWSDHGEVTSIYGAKTLMVGCGDIGGEFASRMHALGSTVTGIRRKDMEKPEYLEKVCPMEELEACLKEADIVATALPGTGDTYHVFDEKAFAAMKPGAFFLNVGRGNAVDSDALLKALNSGHLAGAAIDVTEPEPLPEGHPLWKAENLLITPHVSGAYHLPETHNRIVKIAAENLKRFLAGETLKNIVDLKDGY